MQPQDRSKILAEVDKQFMNGLRQNTGRMMYSACGNQEHFLCQGCHGRRGGRCFVCGEIANILQKRFYICRDDRQERYMREKLKTIFIESIQIEYSKKLADKKIVLQNLGSVVRNEQSGEKEFKPGAYSINLNDHDIKDKQSITKLSEAIINQGYQIDYLENITFPLFLAIDVISSLVLMLTIFLQVYFIYIHSNDVIKPGAEVTLVSLYGAFLWVVVCLMNFMDGFWLGRTSCKRVCRYYETFLNRLLFISVLPLNLVAIFFTLPLITIEQHLKLKHTISWLFPFTENPRIFGFSLLIIPNSVYLAYIYLNGVVTLGWQEDQSYILMPTIFFSLLLVPLVIFMDYRVYQLNKGFEERERQEKEDYIARNDQMYLKVFRRATPIDDQLQNRHQPSHNSPSRVQLFIIPQ